MVEFTKAREAGRRALHGKEQPLANRMLTLGSAFLCKEELKASTSSGGESGNVLGGGKGTVW